MNGSRTEFGTQAVCNGTQSHTCMTCMRRVQIWRKQTLCSFVVSLQNPKPFVKPFVGSILFAAKNTAVICLKCRKKIWDKYIPVSTIQAQHINRYKFNENEALIKANGTDDWLMEWIFLDLAWNQPAVSLTIHHL